MLDENRRPIRGLIPADCTILEDGKPQPISALDEIIVPEAEAQLPCLRHRGDRLAPAAELVA